MKRENKTQTMAQMLKSEAFCKLMGQNKLNCALKQSAIFSFWANIVGSRFSNITKPYAIKGNKLYISANSSVVVQELLLYKNKILNKVNSYSKPLGVEISDIIFNYKNYQMSVPETLNNADDKPVVLDIENIKNVEVKQEFKDKIKENVDKLKFLNPSQKENFFSKIITNEQAKIIQNKHN